MSLFTVLHLVLYYFWSQKEPIHHFDHLTEFNPSSDFKTEQLGCDDMFGQFCDSLFSPKAMGNLKIGKDISSSFTVFRGTTKNNFTTNFWFYSNAKLKKKSVLPPDFRDALEQQDYFSLLEKHLNRAPRLQMEFDDRMQNIRLSYRLQAIWTSAIEETIIKRMRKKYPEFHKTPDQLVPPELLRESRFLKKKLISEISLALWSHHENWKKVQQSFEDIRAHFIHMTRSLKIDEELKKEWVNRISSVRLVVPGSIPEITDEECSTVETNAYYYPRLNVLTVCAGDFNSEDIFQTLAHELAHAIDFDSRSYSFRVNTTVGQDIMRLTQMSCGNLKFSCEEWDQIKNNFSKNLLEFTEFDADVPEFQRCLKQQFQTRKITKKVIAQASDSTIIDVFSKLAERNAFVKLTRERLPLPDGRWKNNPIYLNLCRYSPWTEHRDPFDLEETTLLFFASEFQCSVGTGGAKIENSIKVARTLLQKLVEETIKMEDQYSANDYLTRNGYASSPTERFADVLGSYVLARVLNEQSDLWSKRKLYFATSSWQCGKPSLATAFPEESLAERKYIYDEHSAEKERQLEYLSEPIREALACTKDFNFEECKLSFED